MLKNSLLTLLIVTLLCTPAMARTTGDPLDTNDGPTEYTTGDPLDTNDGPDVSLTTGFSTPGCDNAEKWPDCVPCWTTCLYSLMADAWANGGWNNDGW